MEGECSCGFAFIFEVVENNGKNLKCCEPLGWEGRGK
jgi:hypothetical protein